MSVLFSCRSSCTSRPVSSIQLWSALRSTRTSCLSLFHLAVCFSFRFTIDHPLSSYPIRSSVVLVLCVLLFRGRLFFFFFFFEPVVSFSCMTLHCALVYGLNQYMTHVLLATEDRLSTVDCHFAPSMASYVAADFSKFAVPEWPATQRVVTPHGSTCVWCRSRRHSRLAK